MDMEMKHGLPRFRANIGDGAITLLDVALARDLGGGQVAAANHFRIFRLRFLQSRQNVSWG